MIQKLTIYVPLDESCAYKLFVKGLHLDNPRKTSCHEEVFTLWGDKPVVLFYYFGKLKRAFIVSRWKGVGEKANLPGVEEDVVILFSAKGSAFRSLDRMLKVLCSKDEIGVFKLPILFWYRFAALILLKKATKSSVMNLYYLFKETGDKNGKTNDVCTEHIV